jgi:hypothetical protein
MAQSESRAWWADVQHLRDPVERTDEARRLADQADLAARRALRERRHVEAAAAVAQRFAEDVTAPRRRAEDVTAPRRFAEDGAVPRRRAEDGAVPRRRAEDRAVSRFDDETAAQRRRVEIDSASRQSVETDTGLRRPAEDLAARRSDHVDGAAGAPRLREHSRAGAVPARRVVEIRGRTVPAPDVPRSIEIDRRRPPRRPIERVGSRPDRMAMWALLMGLLLILVAVGTADAGTFAH